MTQTDNLDINSNTVAEAAKEISLPEILKEKRLKLGIEIEDAAFYLKIKPRDIEAIENNQNLTTQHLYILGALRAYAKFLKIDPKIVERKIKPLSVESNVTNTKHNLINIGENLDLKPTKDQFFNFLIISILLFLIFLSLCNFYEGDKKLITTEKLVEELENVDFYN